MAREWKSDSLVPLAKHLNALATGFCEGESFESLKDLTEQQAARAASELARREKLFARRPSGMDHRRLWTRCRACKATMAREWKSGSLEPLGKHLNAFATGFCKGKYFESLRDLTKKEAARAATDLARREKLFAGRPKGKRKNEPLTSGPTRRSSKWDRFESSGARFSRASVGLPGSGQRS
jgi:hypothetical protein